MPDSLIAFTVKLRMPISDPTTLMSTAEEIKDELTSAGMDVESVDPWAQPSIGLPGHSVTQPQGLDPSLGGLFGG